MKAYSQAQKKNAADILRRMDSAKEVFNLFHKTVMSMDDFNPINNKEMYNNMKDKWFLVIVQISMSLPSDFPRGGLSGDIMKAAKLIEGKWWGSDNEWKGGAARMSFYKNLFNGFRGGLSDIVFGRNRIADLARDFNGFCELVYASCREVLG
ncbi:hypothetical protein HYU11_00990 [Candidatus Woesearchaeota archaeon]|nr:hypothetical protein [Candidatus Woesearchaeota archaeon]